MKKRLTREKIQDELKKVGLDPIKVPEKEGEKDNPSIIGNSSLRVVKTTNYGNIESDLLTEWEIVVNPILEEIGRKWKWKSERPKGNEIEIKDLADCLKERLELGPGTQWKEVWGRPESLTEIKDEKLSAALEERIQSLKEQAIKLDWFSKEQFLQFKIFNFSWDCYIEVKGRYFKPEDRITLTNAQYQKLKTANLAYDSYIRVKGTPGLKWKAVGSRKPEGTEITNVYLEASLLQNQHDKTIQFSIKQLEEFKVKISDDSYIKAGETYFQPVKVRWFFIPDCIENERVKGRNRELSDSNFKKIICGVCNSKECKFYPGQSGHTKWNKATKTYHPGRKPVRIDNLMKDPLCKAAKLTRAEAIGLRLYTGAGMQWQASRRSVHSFTWSLCACHLMPPLLLCSSVSLCQHLWKRVSA